MTMSFSPGIPQGAPTLAEVLLSRTFARPPKPFADAELLQALAHPTGASDAAAPSPDAIAKTAASSGSYSSDGKKPDPASGDDAVSTPSSTEEPTAGRVDVRA